MSYTVNHEKTFDIVVLGGGGSGVVAAARAATVSGKKVAVIEKSNGLGGALRFASTMRTFGSKWQKERNLPDVTASFIRKHMDESYWKLDAELVGNCIRGTGQFFDWFEELDKETADTFRVGRYVFDDESGPLGPQLGGMGNGSGRIFAETMVKQAEKLGVEFLTETKVVDVETENGKATAYIVENADGITKINCKASVFSIGSWINNKEIVGKVSPEFLEADMDPSPHTNPNYTGDGVALAEKIGAFVDYDSFCLRLMGPMGMCKSNVMMTMGNSPFSISVNLNAKRYVCEPSQTRMGVFESGHVCLEQPKGICFTIFDENTLAASIEDSKKPKEGDGGFFGHPKYPDTMDQVYADINEGVEKDPKKAFKADTVEELAEMIGVDAAALKKTIDDYNGYCAEGFDWGMFKPAESLVPMNKPPYYAVRATLGTDGAFGGIQVNPAMQAYKKDGGLVEGLYATGDFASGRHISLGGVKRHVLNDMSWALSSGFLAGTSVGEYAKNL